jgi:uncharacterized protein (TIGR02996 family)
VTDRDAFIRSIIAHRDDDLPRLAFADWLDEHAGQVECPRCHGGRKLAGVNREAYTRFPLQPKDLCMVCHGESWVPNGYAERAAFIRVQCELARLHCWACEGMGTLLGSAGDKENPACDRCNTLAVRRRERAAWVGGALFHILDHGRHALPPGTVVHLAADRPNYAPTKPEAYVARGFVESLTCPFADWLAHADAVTAAHPVRAVRLTTAPTGEHIEHEQTGRHEHRYRVRGREGWHTEAACEAASEDRAIYVGLFTLTWPGIAFELPPAEPEYRTVYHQDGRRETTGPHYPPQVGDRVQLSDGRWGTLVVPSLIAPYTEANVRVDAVGVDADPDRDTRGVAGR